MNISRYGSLEIFSLSYFTLLSHMKAHKWKRQIREVNNYYVLSKEKEI